MAVGEVPEKVEMGQYCKSKYRHEGEYENFSRKWKPEIPINIHCSVNTVHLFIIYILFLSWLESSETE
ncbi:hypothetical protein E2C01_050316 [Portunus trituberculatus]|uniref:Uncharacterized protein n=1 Tax=Portunus trituberculatus TaxID=210409 RepID=A0A5B7GFS5_PORTR|nr:hypothetical protein [Portunus trituberculatus]